MDKIALEEVVSLFHKQPAEFIATLKSDNGEWKPEALELVKKGYKDFMDEVVSRYDRKLKAAEEQPGMEVRKRMVKAENSLMPYLEKYEVEKSDVLEETLKTLVEAIEAKAGKGRRSSLTDEEVMELPIFKQKLKEGIQTGGAKLASEVQEKYTVLEKQHNEYVQRVERESVSKVMFEESDKLLAAIKARVDADPSKRREQVSRLNKLIGIQYTIKINEAGKPVIVDENGDVLVDKETYQPIAYADVVKKEADIMFGLNNFDPNKDSPGASNQQPGNNNRLNVPPATDQASYMKQLQAEKDPAKRQQIMEAYEAKVKQNG